MHTARDKKIFEETTYLPHQLPFIDLGLVKEGRPLAFFSELCRGMAMVACTRPQQGKKEERERLRGERVR